MMAKAYSIIIFSLLSLGAISTSALAPKPADPEIFHKGPITSTPSKIYGAIDSVVD